jgi:hypothetical protein
MGRILKDDGLVVMTVDFWRNGIAYDTSMPGRIYDRESLESWYTTGGFERVDSFDWDDLYRHTTEGTNSFASPKVGAMPIALRKVGV